MMEVRVLNMEGEEVKSVTLPAGIFEVPINSDLIHQALMRQLANARLGTHATKTRGEVRGGGHKPWRQKGTGRARQGSTRAPQWKGGGRVHTPHPRDYTMAMPVKMRRAALRSALSLKAAGEQIVLVDELTMEAPRTREMAQTLNKLAGSNSALIVLAEKNEAVEKSVRNLPNASTLLVNYLNIRDLLGHDRLVLPLGALEALARHLG